jgi:hypothetical protein
VGEAAQQAPAEVGPAENPDLDPQIENSWAIWEELEELDQPV